MMNIFYTFNPADLKKAEATQDEIALIVLRDNGGNITVSSNLKIVDDAQPDDDQIIAAFDDANFTVLHKFSAGVLDKIGTNFQKPTQVLDALTKNFGKKFFRPAI